MSTRQHTEDSVSLHDQHSDANVSAAFHWTPEMIAEVNANDPRVDAYEPTAEELEAEHRAYQARRLAATYERSVGGASRGRFVAYVKLPGAVRPVKAGTFNNERDAWAAADRLAVSLAAAYVAKHPEAA